MEALAIAAAPLLAVTDLTGRVARPAFARAALLALAAVATGWAMDRLVFGAIPGRTPPYFAALAALAVAPALPALTVRRLNDTGRSGRWALLVLVPVAGWAVLAWLLTRPGTRPAEETRP